MQVGGPDDQFRRSSHVGSWTGLRTALVVVVVVGVLLAVGGIAVRYPPRDKPKEGHRSLRLPVHVEPAANLRPGQQVHVTSSAFHGVFVVGVAMCLREADTDQRGVKACDTVHGSRFHAEPGGRLDATYRVRRVITVGSKAYDCARRPGRCLLVAADSEDYDRSGARPLRFRPGLPPAPLVAETVRAQTNHLPVIVRPQGPVRTGQELVIDAAGFQPGEDLLTGWCTRAFASEGITACDPSELFKSKVTLNADRSGKIHRTRKVPRRVKPSFSNHSNDRVTCADRPGACMYVIAAYADSQRSAVVPITIRR